MDLPGRNEGAAVCRHYPLGFIKAEVYTYEDIMEYKTEAALREHGKLRIEGKDYVMKDGDIVFFRFNV